MTRLEDVAKLFAQYENIIYLLLQPGTGPVTLGKFGMTQYLTGGDRPGGSIL